MVGDLRIYGAELSLLGEVKKDTLIDSMLTGHDPVQTQGRNIRHYTNYIGERARSYRDTKCDFVRGAENRLEKMSVDKGLLRETEVVQHQITALLKCDVRFYLLVES